MCPDKFSHGEILPLIKGYALLSLGSSKAMMIRVITAEEGGVCCKSELCVCVTECVFGGDEGEVKTLR